MTTETIVGFDSAWTDNVPGALCSITLSGGAVVDFCPPELIGFVDAAERVERIAPNSDYTLVALDQPTLVPESSGMRPVERVAASVVNSVKGGVQPANRGKQAMFGDDAPVWKFLERICARENPAVAREASAGCFLIEVFPALALPSMIPEIWQRRRAAKYNPQNRSKFQNADWELVAKGVASFADSLGIEPIVVASREMARLDTPKKSDQDKLDALICLTVAIAWRFGPTEASLVIGDGCNGYMVTPVTLETQNVLMKAANRTGVPINGSWIKDARRHVRGAGSNLVKRRVERADRSASEANVQTPNCKTCPECGHVFSGKGWGGIDAHWKAKHEDIMPYELAWPLIRRGQKPSTAQDH